MPDTIRCLPMFSNLLLQNAFDGEDKNVLLSLCVGQKSSQLGVNILVFIENYTYQESPPSEILIAYNAKYAWVFISENRFLIFFSFQIQHSFAHIISISNKFSIHFCISWPMPPSLKLQMMKRPLTVRFMQWNCFDGHANKITTQRESNMTEGYETNARQRGSLVISFDIAINKMPFNSC